MKLGRVKIIYIEKESRELKKKELLQNFDYWTTTSKYEKRRELKSRGVEDLSVKEQKASLNYVPKDQIEVHKRRSFVLDSIQIQLKKKLRQD